MDIAPRRSYRRKASLTPLIDVVFILLLFFMLASSFSDWTSVSLGSGSGARAGGDDAALLVTLEGEDGLALAGEPVTLVELERRLAARIAAEPGKAVAVQLGQGASLQRVIAVMDASRRAGVRSVTLVGEP